MPYCIYCGHQIAVYAQFCATCGGKIERTPIASNSPQPNEMQNPSPKINLPHRYHGSLDSKIEIKKTEEIVSPVYAYLSLIFGILGGTLGLIFGLIGFSKYKGYLYSSERKMCTFGIFAFLIWSVFVIYQTVRIASDIIPLI